MEKFEIGDLVVLTAGSMRMAVEGAEGDRVSVVWCHEGRVGRDAFDARLLKRWEFREEEPRPRPQSRGGDREPGRYAPRGERPERGERTERGERGDRPERPKKSATGWDGKPREKKFFRKD